jgi:hypothetical protein
MDGWDNRYLAQCRFLFYKMIFEKNGGRVGTYYSEGTAVARERFGVLVGYCRGSGEGHV